MEKEHFSTQELADLLGISRVAVFKKIQSGEIKAKKVGRNYVISKKDIPQFLNTEITTKQKKEIDKAVEKTAKEYGTALKMLGKE